MTADRLALDRASVRTRDANGYLHVAASNISKASVNPYLGAEIPGHEKLGLDPLRRYQLLRDPEELKKAAPTFDGMPLMVIHKPQAAKDFERKVVVGAISNPVWKDPYLQAELTIWDGSAIAGVETNEQREISCGYRYDADMTPGEFEGVAFDGVMRNLRANHVALVPDGRAGSDVIVGDSKPHFPFTKEIPMAKAILSHKAAYAKGALSVYLAPKLAQDAKLDFRAILQDVTGKNFGTMKPKLVERITAATKDLMAQDASLDDLNLLLDKLDEAPEPGSMAVGDTDPDDGMVGDGEGDEALKGFLKDKLSPEDHAKFCEMMGGKPAVPMAGDAPPPFPGKPEVGGKEEPLTKQAMDAAIDVRVKAAEQATVARLNGVRDAERDVQQWVGSLSMAHDSAEGVYRSALGMLGVAHKDIKEAAALKAVLHAHPKPGARPAVVPMAQDAASATDFAKRYPNAARIKSI